MKRQSKIQPTARYGSLSIQLSISLLSAVTCVTRGEQTKTISGVSQRGSTYQVRISGTYKLILAR